MPLAHEAGKAGQPMGPNAPTSASRETCQHERQTKSGRGAPVSGIFMCARHFCPGPVQA